MTARNLARWGIGIVILVALVLTFDATGIGARLADASLPLVAFGVVGLSSLHLLGAATWRTLARRLVGLRLDWWPTVRLYYAAQAVGGFTPANLGSDAYRVVAVRGSGEGVRTAVLPIVVQRATSYLAVSLVGAAALLIASRPTDFAFGLTIGAVALAGVALGVASLVSVGPGRLRPLRDRLLGPDAPDRRRLAGAVGIGLALGVLFHAMGVGLTFLVVLSVDPGAASLAALAAVAVARVSLLIPLTPSGLGVQEAALALLFVGIGLPAESAIAASLLARLSLVLTAAIGAAVLLLPAGQAAIAGGTASAGRR
ncbi:MAG: lysylphosphatidylglycerol synthase transmembrane domain-containing protein [Chloroflexota bacterium]